MVIIETPIFTKQAEDLWSAEEYRQFQVALLERPDMGEVIVGGRGLRKARWTLGGRGKRGGARIIYVWYVEESQLYLLLAYDKHDQDDLTPDQLKRLRELID